MRVTRAYALLPVLPTELASLDASLEHLVAAADEAAAAGVPTTLVLSTSMDPALLAPTLTSWAPLIDLLDDVDLVVHHVVVHHVVDHQHGAVGPVELHRRTSAALRTSIVDPESTVVLTSTCGIGVGPGWIAEHVRHHREGAWASTGPVRGTTGPHPVAANFAVRADLLPVGGLSPSDLQRIPVVHAVTPVVATLRVTLPAFP